MGVMVEKGGVWFGVDWGGGWRSFKTLDLDFASINLREKKSRRFCVPINLFARTLDTRIRSEKGYIPTV